MYNPTDNDIRLVTQGIKNVKTKIEILDDNDSVLGVIYGTVSDGTHNIDSSASVRRTFSVTVSPDADSIVQAKNFSMLVNAKYKIYTLVYDELNDTYIEYPNGVYLIQDMYAKYDASSNTLKLQLSDLMTKYNGSISGSLPAYVTRISPYDVDEMGNPVEDPKCNLTYHVIKNELIGYLNYAGIKKYVVLEDIGEYRGIARYNNNYLEYRKTHPQWNCIPYEVNLSPDDTYETVFNKLCTFYPNYDYAFDEDGIFTLKMIPSTYDDDIVLDNSQIQKVLLSDNSENRTINISTVKNISIVWGKCFSPDYYVQSSTYYNATNIYTAKIEGMTQYAANDIYAINIEKTNTHSSPLLNINGIGNCPIYDETMEKPIQKGYLTEGFWCFRFKNDKMYVVGRYQIHAVNVLSNGTNKEYTKEFFEKKYKCDNVSITIIKDYPFAIEEIGFREKAYNDEKCQNLTSNSTALSYAEYLTWQSARLNDELTLSCTLIPWLREYEKISYKPKDIDEERQYIIKSISHDYANGSTQITAYRFYPLYMS